MPKVIAKCALGHEWNAVGRLDRRKSRALKHKAKAAYFTVYIVKPKVCPVCGRKWQQFEFIKK